MKVTFYRHGQSMANLNGIIQGSSVDTPLSEKGVADALKASETARRDFDVCFCSHLMRARQTAEILFPYLEPIVDDRIIERGLGVWEGQPYDESRRLLEYQMTPEGGEDFETVNGRVRDFLEMLKRDYAGKRIVCVSHAGAIWSAMEVCGVEPAELGNVGFVELDY